MDKPPKSLARGFERGFERGRTRGISRLIRLSVDSCRCIELTSKIEGKPVKRRIFSFERYENKAHRRTERRYFLPSSKDSDSKWMAQLELYAVSRKINVTQQ